MPAPVVVVDVKPRWSWIKGYKGYYLICDDGRIRAVPRFVRCRAGGVRRCKSRIIKTSVVGKGYVGAHLSKEGVLKTHPVHRLVAQMFIPNPDNLPEVNHKDGIKTNNHWTNLEWTSELDNTRHAVITNLVAYGTRVKNAKLNDQKARRIYRATGLQREIAEKFGVTIMIVSLIKRRKLWRRATEVLCRPL